ncbi:HlyD family secretion protein [Photobacterium iliopiscarium]|uniref:HlyD family secretion protein n=1 Tax=Photobacterium iliopiscarium TaxID=56192 RepID=UPI001E2DF78D|nr:HlyD family secretion protein [Photobacterium iliopiscarium]MCD9468018.1 multidrug transporter [Photobacterium iliopiscarium]MCD9487453.1 biotin/lipoyl-binding protein [Photobacterium iliopiscarium]MCF2244169.1 biotin/lipoyl-binding protein [Photobacterium iliopiscarium]
MKEKMYQYIIYSVLTIVACFSLFLLISDNVAPFTTQSTLYRAVANISPQVSGVITNVAVENGQNINKGELLFTIDPAPYALKVRQAQADLAQADQNYSAQTQQLVTANQLLKQRQLQSHNAAISLARFERLINKGLVTRQQFDDAQTQAAVAKSAYQGAKAEVLRIKALLNGKSNNAAVELAQVKLAQAQLDLTHTRVIAQTTGTITNLQLQVGSYINQATPALFIVNENNVWLSADFNEKGMTQLQPQHLVYIAFDAIPGKVFTGEISSQDRAEFDAENPNNQLSSVTNDKHWIRELQKIRTRITVNDLDPALISGARASVIVQSSNPIINTIAQVWIKLVAIFHYIY